MTLQANSVTEAAPSVTGCGVTASRARALLRRDVTVSRVTHQNRDSDNERDSDSAPLKLRTVTITPAQARCS